MADYELTDTEYEPTETGDWKKPVLCAHCGEQIGMHYQHADGKITCVRFADSISPDQS